MQDSYYDIHAKAFIEDTVNIDMSEIYARFTPYLPQNARILDAGCGSGRDSLAFIKMGYQVDAFDASSEMVKCATKFTGLNVKQTSFAKFRAIDVYDGIWSCASLLHIPLGKLYNSMRPLSKALKRSGVWYVSFKYGEGERQVSNRHFTDLTEKNLTKIVNDLHDIQIQCLWITQDSRPFCNDRWLNGLLIKV